MLVDIVDATEQKMLVSLMEQVYIEPAVVCEQLWMSAMEQAGLVPESQLAIERFTMLEYTNDPEWPEARIKQGFLKKEIKAKEENMVRACEWFLQIHGDPRGCLDALTNVCKAFLRNYFDQSPAAQQHTNTTSSDWSRRRRNRARSPSTFQNHLSQGDLRRNRPSF